VNPGKINHMLRKNSQYDRNVKILCVGKIVKTKNKKKDIKNQYHSLHLDGPGEPAKRAR
jgi:Na+-transporting NADH:ubiquinone oxidoreductase subunit NqrC